jgi:hypothetical protein
MTTDFYDGLQSYRQPCSAEIPRHPLPPFFFAEPAFFGRNPWLMAGKTGRTMYIFQLVFLNSPDLCMEIFGCSCLYYGG